MKPSTLIAAPADRRGERQRRDRAAHLHAGHARRSRRRQLTVELDGGVAILRTGAPLAPTRIEMTLSGSNPGDTLCSRTKLRTSSPAPISSISEIATSATTSRLRSRRRERAEAAFALRVSAAGLERRC